MSKNTSTFNEVPHTADWAFQVKGETVTELFINAAQALFALQGCECDPGASINRHYVELTGVDFESLLVNWLSEIIYIQDTEREACDEFSISALTINNLVATIGGRRFVHIDKIIKAVTFHGLQIEQGPEGYRATIVVDV